MKKIWILALGVLGTCAVSAQNDTIVKTDTLTRTETVLIRSGRNNGELALDIGGYSITLDRRKFNCRRCAPVAKRPARVSFGLGHSEFGFSLLLSPDYSKYSDEQHGFLEQRVGKSIHLGTRLLNLEVALNRSHTLSFLTGMHLMVDNYVFSQNITLQKVTGMIQPVLLDKDYKKSKLTTASFGVPLQLTFAPNRYISFSALVYGDLVVNSHTKYKKPIVKDHLSGINQWQCGVGGAISYRKVIGVYCKYGLTSFFESGAGPQTHPLSVGLCFGF